MRAAFYLLFLSLSFSAFSKSFAQESLRPAHEPSEKIQLDAEKWQKKFGPMLHFGSQWSRVLLHMHSVSSHDACDGKPRDEKTGEINLPCLQDFRRAMCDHHVDHVFMSEHRGLMAQLPFNEVIPVLGNDVAEIQNGQIVKVTHSCPPDSEGYLHQVHFYQGSENGLMPLGLNRHPDLLPGLDLEATYNARSPEAVENFKNAGALVGVSHLEDKKLNVADLQSLNLDYLEIYNVHANLKTLHKPLQLKLFNLIPDLAGFLIDPLREPDLFALSFLKLNKASFEKWGKIAQQQRMPVFLGSDTHQNLPVLKMWDKERIDSYRRANRWYSNYIGAGPLASRAEIFAAIRQGKVLGVFELFGIPNAFYLTAQSLDGSHTIGMGQEWMTQGQMVTIRAAVPKVINRLSEKFPDVVTRLMRSDAKIGWVEVARSKGDVAELAYRTDQKGAYRAEIWIRPKHLNQNLPGMFHLHWQEYPWIISNPIYLR